MHSTYTIRFICDLICGSRCVVGRRYGCGRNEPRILLSTKWLTTQYTVGFNHVRGSNTNIHHDVHTQDRRNPVHAHSYALSIFASTHPIRLYRVLCMHKGKCTFLSETCSPFHTLKSKSQCVRHTTSKKTCWRTLLEINTGNAADKGGKTN
jgi:hypothetical protein